MDERLRALLVDGYAALERGDVDTVLEGIAPDFELEASGAFLDGGTTYRGREGVRRGLEMLADALDGLSYDLIDLIEVDDRRVLALVCMRGRGRESGVEVEREGVHLWTVRDYQAISMRAFADLDEARAAAGLT